MKEIAIKLSIEEYPSFLEWRKNRAMFDRLVESNVFDMRNGSVEVHFDASGQIGSIDAHVKLFRRTQVKVIHSTIIATPLQNSEDQIV